MRILICLVALCSLVSCRGQNYEFLRTLDLSPHVTKVLLALQEIESMSDSTLNLIVKSKEETNVNLLDSILIEYPNCHELYSDSSNLMFSYDYKRSGVQRQVQILKRDLFFSQIYKNKENKETWLMQSFDKNVRDFSLSIDRVHIRLALAANEPIKFLTLEITSSVKRPDGANQIILMATKILSLDQLN